MKMLNLQSGKTEKKSSATLHWTQKKSGFLLSTVQVPPQIYGKKKTHPEVLQPAMLKIPMKFSSKIFSKSEKRGKNEFFSLSVFSPESFTTA